MKEEKNYFIIKGKKIFRQPVISFSRVVGWLVPIKNFNEGKKSEWLDRKNFIIKK